VADQTIRGNQNVQIQDVDRSLIQVIVPGQAPRTVPLEPAHVPVAARLPSPARLVRAHAGVVPYVDRGGFLGDLRRWVHTPAPFAGQVIGGGGGSGKTRLAVELCSHVRDDGWLCGFLARIADPGMLDALVDAPAPRLVIVDYAESRVEQLELLLPFLKANASAESPVRALLLVRADPQHAVSWSERLQNRIDSLDSLLDECEVRILEEAPLDASERAQLFGDAATAFANRLEQATVATPPELDEEVFGSPLMVVMAAYLAAQGSAAPPSTRTELLDELLAHEQRYWRSSAAELSCDEVLLKRLVALATLISAESETGAAESLRLLPDLVDAPAERRNRIARWVSAQYPGPRWWNPLEPDLLGERLVAECFAGEKDLLATALSGSDPDAVTRPLEVLARAAADHPDLETSLRSVLSDELERLCKLAAVQAETAKDHDLLYGNAVTAAAAIDAAITAVRVSPAALTAGLAWMPSRSNLVLNELAVTLTMQGVEHESDPVAPGDRVAHERNMAAELNDLSVRLSYAGRHEEALETGERSVEISRRLRVADGVDNEPELAMGLTNLTAELAYTGRYEEALTASEESVGIYRRLAADDSKYGPSLALALNNLANDLAHVRRHEEALTANEESVEMYRGLDADVYAPALALALNNLSNGLAHAGRHEEALKASEESVEIRRGLTATNPAAHEQGLAKALNNFSLRLAHLGHRREALKASTESVEIFRRLVAVSPAAYGRDFVGGLKNLIATLEESGHREDAARVRAELDGLTAPQSDTGPGD
jgi:tetratricopeptide (TPR) repeat protein